MNGFSTLMFIFASVTILMGLYMSTGRKIEILAMKPGYKGLTKEGWKNIGKWTIIVSLFIYLISIIGLFIN